MNKTCLGAKQVKGRRGPARSARRQLADKLKLSRHKMYQAIAIASIPTEDFERMINSPEGPPSLEELARIGRGKQGRPKRRTKACPHCGETL